MPYVDHHKRSVSKAITFRALIVVTDIFVIFAVTRKVSQTLALIAYTNLAGTVLYYIHERLWNRVRWGRHQKRSAAK